MSVAGIFSSSLFNCINSSVQNKTQTAQNNTQQFQQQFQQLGQALQSGNLSSAQAEFQQMGAQASSVAQSNTSLPQQFNQLSTDLQSGNLSAAQQDYASIEQNSQNVSRQMHHHHHEERGSEESTIGQSLTQVGQALQAGNLSAAQQAYSTVQQQLLQFPQGGPSSQPGTNSVAVNI